MDRRLRAVIIRSKPWTESRAFAISISLIYIIEYTTISCFVQNGRFQVDDLYFRERISHRCVRPSSLPLTFLIFSIAQEHLRDHVPVLILALERLLSDQLSADDSAALTKSLPAILSSLASSDRYNFLNYNSIIMFVFIIILGLPVIRLVLVTSPYLSLSLFSRSFLLPSSSSRHDPPSWLK